MRGSSVHQDYLIPFSGDAILQLGATITNENHQRAVLNLHVFFDINTEVFGRRAFEFSAHFNRRERTLRTKLDALRRRKQFKHLFKGLRPLEHTAYTIFLRHIE